MRTAIHALLVAASLAVPRGASAQSYATTFDSDENPISEAGRWIQNASVGSPWWQNIKIVGGHASGVDVNQTSDFQDATAILAGTWGPDQTVEAKVWMGPTQGNYPEIEIRLRSQLGPKTNRGYECLFSVNKGYSNIVRWNGPEGDFTILAGGGLTLKSGDLVKATIAGNVITMYLNGSKILQTTDSK